MDKNLLLFRKRRPSMDDCGVKPLARQVHHFLLPAYIMWPVTLCFGHFLGNPIFVFAVMAAFGVMFFLLYNLLVAMVQMSHDEGKRLRISQWIFYVSMILLSVRLFWVLSV